MKLTMGLAEHSSGWEQLCAQEGITCTVIELCAQNIADECSVLIVNKELHEKERNAVEAYLRSGGAVIGWTRHLLRVGGTEGLEQKIDFIVGGPGDILPGIHLVDVGVEGFVSREANTLRTDTNTFAVGVGGLQGGYCVLLPFDVNTLLQDARRANKNFYCKRDRLPSESVSLVGKGELRQFVHSAFKYLHLVRGMPYVHMWYFPKDMRNVFSFRIDSDGGTREEIDSLYQLGRDNNVAMSWFLDVKSHEPWLDHFRFFAGQEIGLHCYEHQTYPTFDLNFKNIMRGLQEMRRAGLRPSGFTSPFGVWNPGLAQAIDEAGFEYSSEFSYAYDALPLHTEVEGRKFNTLQVPIHPICIGSLQRVGYSEDQMSEYFASVVDRKLSRNEPLFFYHHPSHRRWKVVEKLFGLVHQRDIENMTMGDYARWWKRRIEELPSIKFIGSAVRADDSTSAADDIYIRIVSPDGREAIMPTSESIDLASDVQWTTQEPPSEPPADLRRIREFDPRQVLGGLYNTLIRKLK